MTGPVEIDSPWKTEAAFSHPILMFLLWVKVYGVADAVHYAFDTELELPAEFCASIFEFCRLENIDLSK